MIYFIYFMRNPGAKGPQPAQGAPTGGHGGRQRPDAAAPLHDLPFW